MSIVRRDVWVGVIGSILFTASLGLLVFMTSKQVAGNHDPAAGYYGMALFVAMPILHGMAAGLLSQLGEPQPWGVATKAASMSVALMAVGVLVFAIEGIVCLLMAAPLVVPLVFMGTWVGWKVRHRPGSAALSLPTVGILAAALGGGPILPAPEFRGEVVTRWWIPSPPKRVWPYVLNMERMPEPDWWLFRMGVAHPIQTVTIEDGSRLCDLSTGPMPEIVTLRQEEKRLAFRILSTPPSMRELNPWGEVHAPHLTATYRGIEGEFQLFAEQGGTRVLCRSAYGLRMAPAWYWRLWSDLIVAHVHERVIGQIRQQSLTPPSSENQRSGRGKVTS